MFLVFRLKYSSTSTLQTYSQLEEERSKASSSKKKGKKAAAKVQPQQLAGDAGASSEALSPSKASPSRLP
ncbi:hypothetical protein EUX98_g7231 [Antrodiella citrinella]|uniref:Uncharacterized protein n=1 Tax=Antrodiella citrinella TaxID=2447956 RepID=A0A4S4MNS2_9APHY|nr:hypothetical protein EUX98_g7231 [Antrodiella citrinella]